MVVALSSDRQIVSSTDTRSVLLVDTHTGKGERSHPPHPTPPPPSDRGSERQALTSEGRNCCVFSKDAGKDAGKGPHVP